MGMRLICGFILVTFSAHAAHAVSRQRLEIAPAAAGAPTSAGRAGAAFGTMFGMGIGHAIQGRSGRAALFCGLTIAALLPLAFVAVGQSTGDAEADIPAAMFAPLVLVRAFEIGDLWLNMPREPVPSVSVFAAPVTDGAVLGVTARF